MSDPRTVEPSPFLTPRQREDERAQKRQALLLAAVRAFNDRGFQNTSLDEVAASLGVTKPVIYHYLGNKDAVLSACMRMGLQQLQDAAAEARRLPGTGLARLRHFLCRYGEIIMSDFGRCIVLAGDQSLAPASRAELRAQKREIDHTLRALVTEAAEDGSATIADARLTAFALAGALNGTAQWFKTEGPLPAATAARQLADILCAGLEPRSHG